MRTDKLVFEILPEFKRILIITLLASVVRFIYWVIVFTWLMQTYESNAITKIRGA